MKPTNDFKCIFDLHLNLTFQLQVEIPYENMGLICHLVIQLCTYDNWIYIATCTVLLDFWHLDSSTLFIFNIFKMTSRGYRHGYRRSSTEAPSKTPKRDFGHVLPNSPGLSMSEFQRVLKEELSPIYQELDKIKLTVNSAQVKINSDLEKDNSSVEAVSGKLDIVQQDLLTKINKLELEYKNLRMQQTTREKRVSDILDRLIKLEGHSRRNNLKFLNIDLLEDGDAIEDCESLIIRLCHGKGIILDSRDIVRAHRTGPIVNNKGVIIVKFTHYKDKQKILKLKSTFFNGLMVIEDFPPEILEKRKIFSPILRAAHNSNGKYHARLVVDRLIVNGKQYSASEIDNIPRDLNPKKPCNNVSGKHHCILYCIFTVLAHLNYKTRTSLPSSSISCTARLLISRMNKKPGNYWILIILK